MAGCSSTPAMGCALRSARPRAAIDAAVEAQRRWGCRCAWGSPPVRPSVRGDDYFGPALNRAARVMAAGHGGQILVAASTASLVSGVDLVDLGEHRLRDLSGVEHLFQVRADGLRVEFPPLRTLDAVPGNLPVQLDELRGPRGRGEGAGRAGARPSAGDPDRGGRGRQDPPGGPGRRRAGRRSSPMGCGWSSWRPSATRPRCPMPWPPSLGRHRRRPGSPVTDSIVQALSGRRLLVVLDNCEHLLDAAADLVEAILAHGHDGEGARHLAGKGCGWRPSSCGRSRRSTSRPGRPRRRWSCSSNGPGPWTRTSSSDDEADGCGGDGDLPAAGRDRAGHRAGGGPDGVDEPAGCARPPR